MAASLGQRVLSSAVSRPASGRPTPKDAGHAQDDKRSAPRHCKLRSLLVQPFVTAIPGAKARNVLRPPMCVAQRRAGARTTANDN